MRMMLLPLITAVVVASAAMVSVTGLETSQEWNARIDARIDAVRKGDGEIALPLAKFPSGERIRLIVNQTRQTIPLGTALKGSLITACQNSGNNDNYCSFAKDNFNFAVLENAMKWRYFEPQFGQFNTESSDRTIEWAHNLGWGVRGHCLFWDVDDKEHYPDWVYNLRGSEMVDAINHRLDSTVNMFRGRVEHWDINNEMLHGDFFRERTGDPNIRASMFIRSEEIAPEIRRFVNDYNVLLYETENYVNQILDLLNSGAPVSGIGCQAHLGSNLIDFAKVESTLDRLWNEFHIPIWITEFDFRDEVNDNHATHAQQLEQFYRLALSHPGVEGVLMWGFWDQAHWIPNAAIVNGQDFVVNKAGEAYIRIFHEIFQTHLVLQEGEIKDDMMQFRFRGFKGEYNVTLLREDGRQESLQNILIL